MGAASLRGPIAFDGQPHPAVVVAVEEGVMGDLVAPVLAAVRQDAAVESAYLVARLPPPFPRLSVRKRAALQPRAKAAAGTQAAS